MTDRTNHADRRSPWMWIPTLYIAEGLPYFAVNTLAVVMYTRMGVGLTEMAFFTGWLYLPWVIKPFWSPFVDIFGTRRNWVIAMQFCIGISMALVALCLPLPFFFASTLSAFWLMAFFSATHDIAADGYYMLALTPKDQAAYVGLRNTFYRIASLIGQGGMLWLAGEMEERTDGNIPYAWSVTFVSLSIVFLAISVYHTVTMPRPHSDRVTRPGGTSEILREFGNTFATFFGKRHIVTAIAFMLLYRLAEALMLKVSGPFLLAPLDEGGLGLSTKAVGIATGTTGVAALLAGGIIGGICIARRGLRYWLWPMAMAITLPGLVYCYMAMAQPKDPIIINACIGFEQLGYGFGFTAFMMYLIYFCDGEYKTSHYAFCTAFMALGMMLPGMAAGWIHEQVSQLHIFGDQAQGYINYFCFVMLCSVSTYAVCAMVRINRTAFTGNGHKNTDKRD